MQRNFTHFSNASFVPHEDEDLKEISSQDITASPSDEVINNILNFSRALKVERSQSVGSVEIVLN